jgi:hypothetical protein
VPYKVAGGIGLGFPTSPAHLTQIQTQYMKETIISLFRHALTAMACLGTFMYSQGYMGSGRSFAPSVAAVNASGAAMSNALSAVLVAVLTRLFLKFSGKVIDAHVNEGKNNNGFLGLLLGMVVLIGMALPSCSPAQLEAARSIPIRATYVDAQGRVFAYDPQTGVSVMVVEAAK